MVLTLGMLTNVPWCMGQRWVGKVLIALEGVVGAVCRGDWVGGSVDKGG